MPVSLRKYYKRSRKLILNADTPLYIVNVKPSAFLSDEFYGTLEKMQKTN